MQKVIVQVDWYTKIILTLIAVLLVGVFVKVCLPSYILGARTSAFASWGNPKALKAAAMNEDSDDLAEYLYLYVLQDLPQKKSLEIIDKNFMLSDYRAAKAYAESLVVQGRNKAYRSLSSEVIKTVLFSGRFVVTPYGIVQSPLEVKLVGGSTAKKGE
jgi:hypothetical protein